MALGLTELPSYGLLSSAKEQHASKTFWRNQSVHKYIITVFVVANNTFPDGTIIFFHNKCEINAFIYM